MDYNQVFLDPSTGAEVGRREWGKPALTRENFIPFLYMLHYSLHLPAMGGVDRWGIWLMGGIALIWTVDCFVRFYLTLPGRRARRSTSAAGFSPDASAAANGVTRRVDDVDTPGAWWRRWRAAWRVKWSGSARRINFDLHRAAGLWLWAGGGRSRSGRRTGARWSSPRPAIASKSRIG